MATARGSRASEPEVLIVGGGAAGLAAALELTKGGREVLLLEKASRPGGVIHSRWVAGHLFEEGPSTVLASGEHILPLVRELGLDRELVLSRPEAKRRYIWRHGRLHPAPLGPGALLTTRLLSVRGKLRALWEPFVRAPELPRDETLRTFLERRLGREAVDALVDPFVTGVFAGNPDQLGSDAFARLADLERDHGSLFRGMLKQPRQGKPGRPAVSGLVSFAEGLQRLPQAIASGLGDQLRTGVEVASLGRTGNRWQVETADGSTWRAPALVLATPAWAAAALLQPIAAEAARILAAIPHPEVVAIGLGHLRHQVAHPLDGFGILCASDSPLPNGVGPILGVLFPSSIFPGRAPEGAVSFSVMLGGTRDPEAASLDDSALVRRACQAVGALCGAEGEPTAVWVARHPRSIPQYTPGHRRRIEEVRKLLGGLPGLRLAGNYLDGPGLDPTVGSGLRAARSLLEAG
jgi:oxygen-dependent protoporphyrinogen oxidase